MADHHAGEKLDDPMAQRCWMWRNSPSRTPDDGTIPPPGRRRTSGPDSSRCQTFGRQQASRRASASRRRCNANLTSTPTNTRPTVWSGRGQGGHHFHELKNLGNAHCQEICSQSKPNVDGFTLHHLLHLPQQVGAGADAFSVFRGDQTCPLKSHRTLAHRTAARK